MGEVGVGRGDASSEGEHAEASDARRTHPARQITMIHLDRRVPRIMPPWRPTGYPVASFCKRSGSDDRTALEALVFRKTVCSSSPEKGRVAAREGRLIDHDEVASRIDRPYRG